jgi:hypothetical protein
MYSLDKRMARLYDTHAQGKANIPEDVVWMPRREPAALLEEPDVGVLAVQSDWETLRP